LRAERRRSTRQRAVVDIRENERSAFRSKALREREPHAARSARDHGELAFEALGHVLCSQRDFALAFLAIAKLYRRCST
jgi:hypothetical protein